MISFWSGRESECKSGVYSRWRTTTHHSISSRMFVFVFCILFILPCAFCEDKRKSSHDEGVSTYHIAEIAVTYVDPETKEKMERHYQGKYGTKSMISHVSGVVMHAISDSKPNGKSKTNHSGCTKYKNKKLPQEPWIALVERGDCDFNQKVKIATQTHNASAIVIYNNGDVNDLMGHDAMDTISVFLLRKEGLKIVEVLNRGTKIDMNIYPGKEFPVGGNMQNSISKTSVLFVSVSFIVLMVVSLAWLVFYYIQRFRYSHAKERLARLLACAAKKAIAKIPQKTIKAGDKELEGDFDQCAVCIEQYKPHDVIRILPCRHVFHKSCIDPWLLDQRSCPMCKLDILRAYGMQVSGSQESVHRDPESGPVTQVVSEDADVRFGVMEDTRAEVLLVPPTWLHVHAGRDTEREGEEQDDSEQAVFSSPYHLSDPDDITVLLPSSPAAGCSNHNVSRAQKRDKEDSLDAETKALIGSGGVIVKHQLSIDEDDEGYVGHSASSRGLSDDTPQLLVRASVSSEQDRSGRTDGSSWTGSSNSLQGLSRCKEIDVSVEVNHESSA